MMDSEYIWKPLGDTDGVYFYKRSPKITVALKDGQVYGGHRLNMTTSLWTEIEATYIPWELME